MGTSLTFRRERERGARGVSHALRPGPQTVRDLPEHARDLDADIARGLGEQPSWHYMCQVQFMNMAFWTSLAILVSVRLVNSNSFGYNTHKATANCTIAGVTAFLNVRL